MAIAIAIAFVEMRRTKCQLNAQGVVCCCIPKYLDNPYSDWETGGILFRESFWANSVSSAKTLVSLLLHTNTVGTEIKEK